MEYNWEISESIPEWTGILKAEEATGDGSQTQEGVVDGIDW